VSYELSQGENDELNEKEDIQQADRITDIELTGVVEK
jgi:hypothetical protein